jgi:hypothetical protein
VLKKVKDLIFLEILNQELEVNKLKLILPMETKVQGQSSPAIILQQNRYICAPEIYATW